MRNTKSEIRNEKGQIAVILLLFILVALTIGLAATQRSLTNIITSTDAEQSSRAFSAAEAGLQRSIAAVNPIVLSGPNPSPPPVLESELGNSANASLNVINNLPRSAAQIGSDHGEPLEYPPIGKDAIAQFWLANPTNSNSNWNKNVGSFNSPQFAFSGPSLEVYWGFNNPVSNPQPAIELNLVVENGTGGFDSHRYFFDNFALGRTGSNNFTPIPAGDCSGTTIHTSSSVSATATDRSFYCHASIPVAAGDVPIILRARILYSNGKEPIAVAPMGNCGINCSLPPQAAIYTSRGFSGQSQKTLQVFRQPFYVSPLLDFALFSAGEIRK